MISDDRLEQFAHDKRMCNVTDEVVSMAKELLNYRPCKHNWNVLRLVEGNGRYQYCTLCGAKKVAD